jgi:dipeptidyl aminopeptidase/acylaminoacyl peptidase
MPTAHWRCAGFLLAALLLATGGGTGQGLQTGDGSASAPDTIPDIETFMQIGYAGDPQISADGTTLYFLSGLTGANQVFRLLPDGWPYQLTVFPDGTDYFVASPDGAWVVVGASRGGNERSQIYLMDGRTGRLRRMTDRPEARYLTPIWAPDASCILYASNEANGRDFHIYRMAIPSGAVDTLVVAEGWNVPSDFDPAGQRLLYVHYRSNVDSDVWLLDLATGRRENLTPHRGDSLYAGATFLPDGRRILLLSNANEKGRLKPAVLDLETRELTFPLGYETPWEVEDGAVSPDRRTAAFVFNEDGYGRLRLYDLETYAERPGPDLRGIVTGVSLSDGPRVALAFTSPTRAPDVWLWDREAGSLRQVTHSTYAGVDPGLFVEPRLVRIPSFDGLEIPAFLYLPPGWQGDPIPFILHIHGGPESQFRPYFNRHFTYLLLHGFGILAPNIRGSSGYGRDYLQLDDYRRRMDAVRDVGELARWLIREGYTRPEMLGIKGTSYGGYMTLAALTQFPELFAAGCDIVGIANFETFLENTAPYRRALREAEYGPLSDREFLREISPLTYVDRIRAALLVVHGENDPRVPISEARQIARALAARGAPVDTLFFPDEGHGVAKRENRLVMYRRMVDFFMRHLRPEP